MRTLRAWLLRFRGLFNKRQRDRELAAELESHLQMHIEDNLRAGMTSEEARRQALIKLGGVEQTKEKYRARLGLPWLESLFQDVRFGLRMLRKSPSFTAVAVLTLALGIGATTAIFSMIDAVIVHPLPFASPDRLVWLNGKTPQSDLAAVSPLDFVEYRASNHSFESLGAMAYNAGASNLVGKKSKQVFSTIVSAGFFGTLGIHPLLGRDFVASDEQVALPQVAILGRGIWRSDFGADPGVIGRTVRLDGESVTIVGVLPDDLPLLSEAQIWLPTPLEFPVMKLRAAHFLKVIGRLKPGVTLGQSQSDLDVIAGRIAREYPDSNEGWTLRQRPLSEVLIGPVHRVLLLISAAVAMLLLIACVNVANLLMARSITRLREFSVRAALGASRWRLIRQALTESAVLAMSAGALGALIATPCIRAIRAIGPADLPRLNDIHMSMGVLLFTAGISVAATFIFGLVPAFMVSGRRFTQGLNESGRGSTPFAHRRLSNALVIAEIAASLTLLVAAGLLLKSFWRLVHVNPGFRADHVVSASLSLNPPAYDNPRRVQFWKKFGEQASALPGVEAFGATSQLPLNGEHSDNPFKIEGRIYSPSALDDANFRQITPGYFAAMRIPLLRGRVFDDQDTETSPGVAVVNEAFAERFFHGQSPLGKTVQVVADPRSTREIVGIVGNISSDALSSHGEPEMYVPFAQYPDAPMHIVVRAEGNPENLSSALREMVRSLDSDVTLSAVRSMDDVFYASVAQPRFTTQILGVFAGLALFLAAIGLYGSIAYSVTQRTSEIGIRMALGATRSNVLALVLKQGSLLALVGLSLGLIVSFAATRLLASQLFEVAPTDPLIFLAVTLLLAAAALAACYIPARRAMRVDPMVALRHE